MMDRIFSFDTMWWILMIIYIPACIGLIIIVLLQKGKGTGFAGAFGAGAGPGADTVFGPRMNRSLPIRLTYIAAALFMVIAIIMSLIAGKVGRGVAPELVQEEATAEETTGTSGLSGYGLGTNRAVEDRVEQPVPGPAVEEAPAVVEEAPAEEAPAIEEPVTDESPEAEEAPISQ